MPSVFHDDQPYDLTFAARFALVSHVSSKPQGADNGEARLD